MTEFMIPIKAILCVAKRYLLRYRFIMILISIICME